MDHRLMAVPVLRNFLKLTAGQTLRAAGRPGLPQRMQHSIRCVRTGAFSTIPPSGRIGRSDHFTSSNA